MYTTVNQSFNIQNAKASVFDFILQNYPTKTNALTSKPLGTSLKMKPQNYALLNIALISSLILYKFIEHVMLNNIGCVLQMDQKHLYSI
jgi:hypothetical protein